MSIKLKSILVLGVLLIIISVTLDRKDSSKCFSTYSIKEKYNYLSKTDTWVITSNAIISYKNNLKEGIDISFEKDIKYNKIYFFVTNNILNKEDGLSLIYLDGKLSRISGYKLGIPYGISLNFTNFSPSLLIVKNNNKSIGSLSFWDTGKIRSIKFGSKFYNKSAVGHNDTYDNGQKAFEYLEENGIKYWAIYNPKGQILIKYPKDNDFCKAKFYEEGKEVKIPYYFDQKEFEEIYEKIKNDVNKSTYL